MKREVLMIVLVGFLIVFMINPIRADNNSFNISKLDVRDMFYSYSFVVHSESNNITLVLDANLSEDYIVTESQGYRGFLTTKDFQKLQLNNINYSCIGDGQYYRWSSQYNQLTFSLTCSNANNDNVFVSVYLNFKVTTNGVNQDGFYNVTDISGYINTINQISLNQRISSIELIQTNQSQRLTLLESWKITTDNTITAIQNTLATILVTLTGTNNRISKLENQSNNSNLNYFKYLSYNDRKAIVCGYAQDNHLKSLIDFKVNCTITYRQFSYGERSYCSCREIK